MSSWVYFGDFKFEGESLKAKLESKFNVFLSAPVKIKLLDNGDFIVKNKLKESEKPALSSEKLAYTVVLSGLYTDVNRAKTGIQSYLNKFSGVATKVPWLD